MSILLSDCYEIPFVGQDVGGWAPPALLEKSEADDQSRQRGGPALSVRTGIGEAEHERRVYGSTGRMNRTSRSTGTARRPFDAWNPVEREMNSRQSCSVSLTRLAIRDVLWSFIFIPHVLPCRFLIALNPPGLLGRSTTVAAVDRTGAACSPTRSGLSVPQVIREPVPLLPAGTARSSRRRLPCQRLRKERTIPVGIETHQGFQRYMQTSAKRPTAEIFQL
ncbi:hypothetical protein K6L27_25205 [Burkholderia cenocepacia]|uniref:hypothetical protein n=1 Tax=Burkholderia cenocepacia TaxID=95486 RepID=UPI00222EB397|nr:hypothetical protein [Burkholderia cenocepacia]MCW3661500.1 hypothetical protein [Burkholderia cenocepacia]